MLGGTGLFNKAHAAVDLHAQTGHVDRHFSGKAFDHGDQIFVDRLVAGLHGCVGGVMRRVAGGCGHVGQGARAFHVGAHGQQHAFDVGVVNDGNRAIGAGQVAALGAVMGEADRFLIRPVRNGNALHADRKTGCVHHDEHILQPAVLLADQITHRAAVVAKLQHRRRAGLDAQFMLNRHTPGVVARTERAIVVDHEFGHHEQRDTFHTFRRAWDTGQHQMDDVLRHVVLAVGDENLGAEHLVAAVFLRFGA